MSARAANILVVIVVAAFLALAACSPAGDAPTATLVVTGVFAEAWSDLLQKKPHPYTTPLPPEKTTAIDGTYSKFDPREGTRPFCVRCMPYPAEGGVWMLQLNEGIFRIFSTRSLNGWRSFGSFTVSEDRMVLFNDPNCHETVGTYTWKLEDGQLVLEVIEDECADGWRAITFTNYPWVLDNPGD